MPDLHGRPLDPDDAAAVEELWAEATAARRRELGSGLGEKLGHSVPTRSAPVGRRLASPDTFGTLLAEGDDVVALAVAMPALQDDGASDVPIPGRCHVSSVAVRPAYWGRRLAQTVLDDTLDLARQRGYVQAQLWTHESNLRAQRLYERTGWIASGRTQLDDFGEPIRHYEREL